MQLLNAIYIEPTRLVIDIIKCKFFKRLMKYDITKDLLENVNEQMLGEKKVKGKWANFITEMTEICNRGLETEMAQERQINRTRTQNFTINSSQNNTTINRTQNNTANELNI